MAETPTTSGQHFKKPSPWWMLFMIPLTNIVLTMTVASSVQLLAELVCRVNRPTPPNEMLTGCTSDPATQATVAKLMAVLSTTAGFLTFLTVGWWGSFADRHGRTRVIAIAASGNLISTLNIIFVARYVERIPGGYWFLLLDSIISGALGGVAAENAAIFAYMGDLATPEERSRLFSLASGFAVVGVAIGPLLGSFLVRITQNIRWVFYLATALRIIQTSLLIFAVPDSLSASQKDAAKRRHRQEAQQRTMATLSPLRRVFFFLEPVAVLWPEKVSKDSTNGTKRDWNLTILVMGYGLVLLAWSSLVNQYQYALTTFRWGAEYLGYCISTLGFGRAVFLILILPLAIKYFKERPARHTPPPPGSEDQPLLSHSSSSSSPSPTELVDPHRPSDSLSFDLTLARFSLLIDILTFFLLPLAPSGLLFILFTLVGTMGAGLGPAVCSVALALYSAKVKARVKVREGEGREGREGEGEGVVVEGGRLFGAVSVVQAVFESILGPALYGTIYAASVRRGVPAAVFYVALGNTGVAGVLFWCVRVPGAAGRGVGRGERRV